MESDADQERAHPGAYVGPAQGDTRKSRAPSLPDRREEVARGKALSATMPWADEQSHRNGTRTSRRNLFSDLIAVADLWENSRIRFELPGPATPHTPNQC
jgi:hypothetical protein